MPDVPNAEDLARIHAACFTVPRPWTAAEFAALLASPPVFLSARPGGFALGRAVAGEAELLTVAVLPDARRQGLGRALVADFLTEARARGATEAFLEVVTDNRAALALYASHGFVCAGARPGYYAGPDGATDALIFRRVIGTDEKF